MTGSGTIVAPPRLGRPLGSETPDPLALPHTDWLRHELIVTGPAGDVAAVREAAAGAGAIPWHLPDADQEEEDRMHALLNPPDGSPGLSLQGARALARALRAAAAARHAQVLAACEAGSRACPFDLHALLPVPGHILRLGPLDPASTAWLRRHWGTVQPLRHVRLRADAPDGRLRRSARRHYEFWSADWTPWAAIRTLRQRWPDVVFDVRPDYGSG